MKIEENGKTYRWVDFRRPCEGDYIIDPLGRFFRVLSVHNWPESQPIFVREPVLHEFGPENGPKVVFEEVDDGKKRPAQVGEFSLYAAELRCWLSPSAGEYTILRPKEVKR